MSYPATIANENPSATWNSFTLEKTTDVLAGHAIYQFIKSNGNLLDDGRIKVNTTTNVWSDYDQPSNTNLPTSVDNGANGVITIQGLPSYTLLYQFTEPMYSSSGGTGTSGGVSTFAAVFNPNRASELGFTITRSGPASYEGGVSSIYLFDENVYLNNPLYTTNWPTGGTILVQSGSSLSNFTLDATKTYYVASAQGTIYATSTPESRETKKVFCNFW